MPAPNSGYESLLWLWALFWGKGIRQGNQDDGLSESLTLLGFLLVWQAALLLYVQSHPKPESRVVAIYIVVSLLPLVGMFSICAIPTLKLHHRRITWRLAVVSVLLVIGLASSYVTMMLPGQFQTGTYLETGNRLLAVNLERNAEPVATMTWTATLSEAAAKHWKIEEVLCFRDQLRSDPIEVFDKVEDSTNRSAHGSFDGNMLQKYYFRIDLEEITPNDPDFKFTMEDLKFEIVPKKQMP